MIRFSCPDCGKRFQVDDALAGRRSQCKGCGGSLLVPGKSTTTTAAARPSPAAKKRASEVDDPYGLAEAAAAESEPGGGAEAAVLPPYRGGRRGSSASHASGMKWAWVGGGVAGASLLLLVVAMLFRGGGRRENDQRGREEGQAEAVAAESTDGDGGASEAFEAAAPTSAGPAPYPKAAAASDVGATASAARSNWRVSVDPPPFADGPYPADLELAIPVPEHYGDPVIYATTASPFVVIGDNNNKSHRRLVYDLRSATQVGQLEGDRRSELADPMVLSPDGRFLATYVISKKPYAVTVWSLADGASLRTIVLDPDELVTLMDFVGPSQVMLAHNATGKTAIWDFQTGEKVRDMPLPKLWNAKSFAISPGRKYVALTPSGFDAPEVLVYDVSTGQKVGSQRLPEDGSYKPNLMGMAFSDDGRALSGLMELHGTLRLLTWDMETGTLESDHKFDTREALGAATHFKNGQALKWLPGGEGWLVNDQAIVERKSGQRVWTIPFDSRGQGLEDGPRKVLNAGRVLALVKPDPKSQQLALKAVAIPAERIGAAVASAKAGGSASDALLPPISAVDLASAPGPPDAGGAGGSWSVQPVKGGDAGSLSHRPITLPAKTNEIISLAMADATAAVGVVLSGPGGRISGEQQAQQGALPRTLHRINLANGLVIDKMEVPAVYDLLAVSPDGSGVLLITAEARDRLDVFEMKDGGRHVAGWRPVENRAKVVSAVFRATDEVLTADEAGAMALWRVKDGSVEPVYVARGACEGPMAMSVDRSLAASFHEGSVELRDAATGALKGRTTAPSGDGSGLKALAFRPDGAELAAVVNGVLARFDLANGTLSQEMPCPAPVRSEAVKRLAYGGFGHLLIDDQALVDLEHQRLVWLIRGGVPAENSPDGALWLAGNSNIIAPAVLGARKLPGVDLTRLTDQAFDASKPAIMRPGSTVSVNIQANPPREAEEFRRGLSQRLASRLGELGINVGADSSATMTVSFREGKSQTLDMKRFGTGGQPQSQQITVSDVEWEISVKEAGGGGAPVVVGYGTVGVPFVLTLRVPPGENDLGSFVRQNLWNAGRRQVEDALLPFYVARGGPGSSAALLLPGVTELGYPTR